VAGSEVDGRAVGATIEDLIQYASEQGAVGYEVDEVRVCVCACGSQVFAVHRDLIERAAKAVCRDCRTDHFVADSAQFWDDEGAAIMVCECDGDGDEENANVAVAFALYADGAGIRALGSLNVMNGQNSDRSL